MASELTHPTAPIRQCTREDLNPIADKVEDFLRQLGGPCWITIPGQDSTRTRLVAALLHGNEPSSIRAVHAWLRGDHEPAVNTVIYVGSVAAALEPPGFAHRALPGHRDANRCYGPAEDDIQGRIAAQFKELFATIPCEAVVDIHNNTGHNPAYGIGFGIDPGQIHLTALFADWYVTTDLHMNTMVEMTGQRCPSIAIECGLAGDPAADAIALAGLDRFLHRHELGLDAAAPPHIQVLQHPQPVKLKPDISIAFASEPQAGAQLTLRDDLDRHNFAVLPSGSSLGWTQDATLQPFVVSDQNGQDTTERTFINEGGEIKTKIPMIPIMMTTVPAIAQSDCLFYTVEPAASA